MSKPVVISGEASETDSEDDCTLKKHNSEHKPALMTSSILGAVVSGEDSESESENDGSICSAISALNQSENDDGKQDCSMRGDSLLQQKLREDNKKLRAGIESYCQSLTDEAGKTLNTADQQLLRSQFTLQNAVTSLKSLSAHSVTLKNKLHSLLSAKFIPNIDTSK